MDYLQGFIMGLAYVAPIGLQNLFVINTALSQPKRRTYATAAIVAFFDITLALACFFGIGEIMQRYDALQNVVLGVGSVIVVYIGISILKSKEIDLNSGQSVDIPILKVITTACVVTWFNPQALIDGTMMLGAFNASLSLEAGRLFITGVATASLVWWFSLSTVISLFKAKITSKILKYINVICGFIIIIYGIKLFINLITNLM